MTGLGHAKSGEMSGNIKGIKIIDQQDMCEGNETGSIAIH